MIALFTPKGAFKIAKASVDIEVQVGLRGFHGLAKKAVRMTQRRGCGRRTITTLGKKLNLKIKILFRTAPHHPHYQYFTFQYTISQHHG
jgi:hypothetical protein